MNAKFNHREVFTILELIPTTQNQALEIIDELKIQITIFIQEDFLEHLKNLSFFFIENFQFEIKNHMTRLNENAKWQNSSKNVTTRHFFKKLTQTAFHKT